MKNLTYFLVSGSILLMSCERDKVVDETALPAVERQYLETHFASIPISRVERETRGNMTYYEVRLQNRIEVEFDANGQAVNVDGQRTERLPDSVIPSKILEYVNLRHSEQYIVEWERDKYDQEIQLSNGTELIFDLEGTFIRTDD